MLCRNNLIRNLAVAALAAVMLRATIAAQEPHKIDASTPFDQLRALAAAGSTYAMLELGERLIQGRGVETNTAEGLQWLHKAADAGKNQAWYDIGFIYSNGVGVETNLTEAMKYFRKGAEAGNADCKWGLGQCYLDGKGLPQDTVQAYTLFSVAIGGVENPAQKQAMTERCDKLGKELTADQLKQAERLTQEWKAGKSISPMH